MPKAIVCDDANMSGDITVAGGCVIHPGATIIAEAGPIIIGENCIVEEYATIVHKKLPVDETATASEKAPVLVIGANNVFEVGCVVEATKIGEKNVFECKSYVSSKVKVASGCVIGAGCRLEASYDLPDNTVIYGRECLQRDVMEKQGVSAFICINIYIIRNFFFSRRRCNWTSYGKLCQIIIICERLHLIPKKLEGKCNYSSFELFNLIFFFIQF